MIHLLHHQVKTPGQRVARMATDVGSLAADTSPQSGDGGRKVLQRSRKRREEWWPTSGRALIHLMQYAVL